MFTAPMALFVLKVALAKFAVMRPDKTFPAASRRMPARSVPRAVLKVIALTMVFEATTR